MSNKSSPQKENKHKNTQNFYKIVEGYSVSYCKKQFLGRSLYGEIRVGYENKDKKIRSFRINSLPISEQAKANLNLQKTYSVLSNCARAIYETVQSQSNRYTVMEYFPKTFKTQLFYFRKLTKNLEPYIEKFLHAYSKLFYYKIFHGNISLDNIGISFDGKVKLMDFRQLNNLTFEEASVKDYRDFRNMVCFILERDKLFPSKFEVFDDPEGNWVKLFSVWHVVNIYQYVYRQKSSPYQNMAILLSKLENVIYPEDQQPQPKRKDNPCFIPKQKMSLYIRIALRLLILSMFKRIPQKQECTCNEIERLQSYLCSVQSQNISFYNSILWGCITDPRYYNIHQMQRLTLISCLIPQLNHQYLYVEILKEFDPNKEQSSKFQLYSNSLIRNYSSKIIENLIEL